MVLISVIASSMIVAAPFQVFAQVSAVDILVVDGRAGTGNLGALFSVDPTTGQRIIISDFGNSGQGPTGNNLGGLDIDASGKVLVVDSHGGTDMLGALFSVDPTTGQRIIISDFGDSSQGPQGLDPLIVRIEASGDALVVDNAAGTGTRGAVFRVDPSTGQRTMLSDFGDSSQGPLGLDPSWIHVDTAGNVLVSEANAPTFSGSLVSVDPSTGQRTILSDFGDIGQGPLGGDPEGLHTDTSGKVLVVDLNAGTAIQGALFSVDPTNGQRTTISDFGNAAQGPMGLSPIGLDIDPSGIAVVTDLDAGTGTLGALFSVDPSTGQRTIISDFGDSGQGPLGMEPLDLIIVPAPANNPPDCSNAAPSVDTLWHPNHKMKSIAISGVTDPDGDPLTITVDSIFQDEPTTGTGSGDKSPDGVGLGTGTAQVRAERSGSGDGRVYHIFFTADDGNGGTCSGEVLVSVQKDQSGNPAIDQGALFDSTMP